MNVLSRFDFFKVETKPLVFDFRSLLLKDLLPILQERDRKIHILDFSVVHPANIEFFTNSMLCKWYVAELDDWTQQAADNPSISLESETEVQMDCSWFLPPTTKLDLVLVWDLLDYLTTEQFKQWFKLLTRFCCKHSLMFALVSNQSQMPKQSGRFKIRGPEHLQVVYPSHVKTESPRHSQTHLGKIMPGFAVRRSYLLQNGMQEYLLEYAGDNA